MHADAAAAVIIDICQSLRQSQIGSCANDDNPVRAAPRPITTEQWRAIMFHHYTYWKDKWLARVLTRVSHCH
jgi:hypothetical protein